MTRPTRAEYEGAFYHVMNRGRGRMLIFLGSEFHALFLMRLAQANRRFGLEVQAYCLMGNHDHLMGRAPLGHVTNPVSTTVLRSLNHKRVITARAEQSKS